jgi:hypothetical protein
MTPFNAIHNLFMIFMAAGIAGGMCLSGHKLGGGFFKLGVRSQLLIENLKYRAFLPTDGKRRVLARVRELRDLQRAKLKLNKVRCTAYKKRYRALEKIATIIGQKERWGAQSTPEIDHSYVLGRSPEQILRNSKRTILAKEFALMRICSLRERVREANDVVNTCELPDSVNQLGNIRKTARRLG